MKKNKVMFFLDVAVYVVQIILMISLSKYTQNNSLFSYFAFSFVYNLILSFYLIKDNKYNIRIIILNLFLVIAVNYFGNIKLFQNMKFLEALFSFTFNVFIFFFLAGNWIVSFIIRSIIKKIKE